MRRCSRASSDAGTSAGPQLKRVYIEVTRPNLAQYLRFDFTKRAPSCGAPNPSKVKISIRSKKITYTLTNKWCRDSLGDLNWVDRGGFFLRRVRELVGDDGHAIAEYMLSVMNDERARTADRLDAGKWLADRGFGRSVQPMDVDLGLHAPRFDAARLSDRELETVIALLQKAQPDDG